MSNGGNPFAQTAADAAEMTNAQLDDKLSRLTRFTEAELRRLFPTKADKQRLDELVTIVGAATAENRKIKELKDNIETLAGTILRVGGALLG